MKRKLEIKTSYTPKKQKIDIDILNKEIIGKIDDQNYFIKFPKELSNFTTKQIIDLYIPLIKKFYKPFDYVYFNIDDEMVKWLEEVSKSELNDICDDFIAFIIFLSKYQISDYCLHSMNSHLVKCLINIIKHSTNYNDKILKCIKNMIKKFHLSDIFQEFINEVIENILIEPNLIKINKYLGFLRIYPQFSRSHFDSAISILNNFILDKKKLSNHHISKEDNKFITKISQYFRAIDCSNDDIISTLKLQFDSMIYIYTEFFTFLTEKALENVIKLISKMLQFMSSLDIFNHKDQLKKIFFLDVSLQIDVNISNQSKNSLNKFYQKEIMCDNYELFWNSFKRTKDNEFSPILYFYSNQDHNENNILIVFERIMNNFPDNVSNAIFMLHKIIRYVTEFEHYQKAKLNLQSFKNIFEDFNSSDILEEFFEKDLDHCYKDEQYTYGRSIFNLLIRIFNETYIKILELLSLENDSYLMLCIISLVSNMTSYWIGIILLKKELASKILHNYKIFFEKNIENSDKINSKIMELYFSIMNNCFQYQSLYDQFVPQENYLHKIIPIIFCKNKKLRFHLINNSTLCTIPIKYSVKMVIHNINQFGIDSEKTTTSFKELKLYVYQISNFIGKINQIIQLNSSQKRVLLNFFDKMSTSILENNELLPYIYSLKFDMIFRLNNWTNEAIEIDSLLSFVKLTIERIDNSSIKSILDYYDRLFMDAWHTNCKSDIDRTDILLRSIDRITEYISKHFDRNQIEDFLKNLGIYFDYKSSALLILTRLIKLLKIRDFECYFINIISLFYEEKNTSIHVEIITTILEEYSSDITEKFVSPILEINFFHSFSIPATIQFYYMKKYFKVVNCQLDNNNNFLRTDIIKFKFKTKILNYNVNLKELTERSHYFEALTRFSDKTTDMFIDLSSFDYEQSVMEYGVSILFHVLHGSSLKNCMKMKNCSFRVFVLLLLLADRFQVKDDYMMIILECVFSKIFIKDELKSINYLTNKIAPYFPNTIYKTLMAMCLFEYNSSHSIKVIRDFVVYSLITNNQENPQGKESCINIFFNDIFQAVKNRLIY